MKTIKIIIYVIFICMMSCNSKPSIDVQGHRGCRGLLPENSLPSFKKAIELGVNTLELDLAISKDKQVVVSHEPYMKNSYCLDVNGNEISKEDELKYNLYKLNYNSIKQFDSGSKFYKQFPNQEKMKVHKPLLRDVFELSESLNADIKYNIEIKSQPDYDSIYSPNPKEFVSLALKVISDYHVSHRVNLQSFDVRALEEIKRQAPTMKVALLVDENESIESKLKELSFKPEIISPYLKLLTKESVENYQKKGYQIIPWTVNSPEDMLRMIDFNVDGIITDYPDRLIKILK